jgi:hypothetical protein
MGTRRLVALLATAALAVPAGALAFGPAPPPGNPGITAPLAGCSTAIDRQLERGVTPGGGPKAGEPGPINCDHYFQDTASPAPVHIGNGWPPPPFQS